MKKRMSVNRKNVILVGDRDCGKTGLIRVCIGRDYDYELVTTAHVEDNVIIEMDGRKIDFLFYDASNEDYENLRILKCRGADVILMCFAIDSPDSLKSVAEKWMPEIKNISPDKPFILVGNKKDLRFSEVTSETSAENKQQLVRMEDGQEIATKCGIDHYLECSAKSKEEIHEMFEVMTKLVCQSEQESERKTTCCWCF